MPPMAENLKGAPKIVLVASQVLANFGVSLMEMEVVIPSPETVVTPTPLRLRGQINGLDCLSYIFDYTRCLFLETTIILF